MPLSHAFSSLGCTDKSLDEVLMLAGTYALPFVELRGLGGTLDLPAHFAEKFGSPSGLAKHLQGSRVKIVALNTSFKMVGASPADRDSLLKYAPWAEAAGIGWLRVFDGGKTAADTELAQAVETWNWWRELRQKHGWRVDLMIETHDSLFTAAAIQRFLAMAPEAAILWDTHHTWKVGGESPLVTWPAIKSRVVHIHVKDSISVASGRHPYTYVLPGAGEFPAAPILAALAADGFAGPVSLEWEKMWHPYLPPLEEALAAARRCNWW